MNTDSLEYLNWLKNQFQFLDITRNGSPISGATAWAAGDVFDPETGNFVVPLPDDITAFRLIFKIAPTQSQAMLDAGFTDIGRQMTMTFEGSATASINTSAKTSNSDGLDTSNRKTWTWTAEIQNSWIEFSSIDHNNPPVLNTIKVFETQFESRVLAGEKFHPGFVSDHTGWAYLRHMNSQGINGSSFNVEDYADIATENFVRWSGYLSGAPVGKIPISVLIELSNETGVPLYYNFPHLITDSAAQTILEQIRENLNPGILCILEYTNEPWHPGFTQGTYLQSQGIASGLFTGSDFDKRMKWYGYRAAQLFNIAGTVFNNRSRWYGTLGTWTAVTSQTSSVIDGAKKFVLDAGGGLTLADILNSVSVTHYFGTVPTPTGITAITKANPGVVTAASHPFSNGEEVFLVVKSASGMVELNETYATVANKTSGAFELQGVDTSAMTTFINAGAAYAMKSGLMRLADQSEANHISDPIRYPTKYTHFNEQLIIDNYDGSLGLGSDATTDLVTKYATHKALIEAEGLVMDAYEGGNHNVGGNAFLTNASLAPAKYIEFNIATGHTQETARGYAQSNAAFFASGGHWGSKYSNLGNPTQFGSWGMHRWQGDDNPIVEVTRQLNENKFPMQLRCA